jgi:hypothetical protein
MSDISAPIFSREALMDMLHIMKECSWTETLDQQLMDLWELCTENAERALLKELIIDMFVLDTPKVRKACQDIDTYISQLNVNPNNSFIVAVADTGKSDGSTAGLKILQLKINPIDEWEERYISHIPDLVRVLTAGDNIFIFDDFIGSGSKIIKKYRWLDNLLKEKGMCIKDFNIKMLSFSAMDFGVDNIKKNLGIDVFSSNIFQKSISGKNTDPEIARKLSLMIDIESKLESIHKKRVLSKYSLGYGKSEALYYWEDYSCPNNVFPIFWWQKAKGKKAYKPLLTRTN